MIERKQGNLFFLVQEALELQDLQNVPNSLTKPNSLQRYR